MANNLGIAIRNEFLKFLAPVSGVKLEGVGLSSLLHLIGHTDALAQNQQLKSEVERIAGLIDNIANLSDEELISWEGIFQILKIVHDVVKSVQKLDSTIGSLPATAEDLGKELITRLFTVYLRSHKTNLFHLASLFNIITPSEIGTPIPMDVSNGELKRLTQYNDEVHLERISEIFSDLSGLLKNTLFLNNLENAEDAHRSAELLFYHLGNISRYWNLNWRKELLWTGPELPPSPAGGDDDEDEYDDGMIENEDDDIESPPPNPPDLTEYFKNYIPTFSIYTFLGDAEPRTSIGISIAVSSAEHRDGIKGFIFTPNGDFAWENTLNGWVFKLATEGNLPEFVIGPGGISILQSTQGKALFTVLSPSLNSNELFHFGSPDGTRIDVPGFEYSIEAKLNNDPEIILSAVSKQSKLILKASDGFLQSVFPAEGIQAPFDLGLKWSNKSGFSLTGGLGLHTVFPLHLSLGPLKIKTISLDLDVDTNGIRNKLSASSEAIIGPIQASIEGIGLSLKSDFRKDGDGNLGLIDLGISFTPPNGVGLSINTGAVTGGGYLYFDYEKGEYAGALELTIAGFISAKAIGLINTKMPDGSKGFSLLIIITAEFNPPFQLGFGFTLNGVGGLLGLNRTVLLEPLREGVKTGAVSNILFPTNVIANATRILSDIRTIFPVYEGKFLIGPMAKIGWGTPSIVTLSFGLIIEIPGNFAILGVLKLILPDEKAAIVKIQVAFVGTIDFDKKLLTFDASLFDSSILQTMTLEGDMAIRLAWGDQPNFLMTVGGFHPAFTPPPLALPTLRRLAINILNTSIAKIRVEFYQAVTSNTVQFGAKAEISFDLKACSIKGHISFDALFQFNPFYFIIELSAGFSLKAVGVKLLTVKVKMSLEGPTPWRAKGTGSISLLFIKVSANFDKTWGDSKTTTLPEITILPLFIEQLQKKEQWSTALSHGKNLLVSLRKLDEAAENLLVLHPSGSLIFQQKLLPLNVNIDKIGNQKTADIKELKINTATSNGTSLTVKKVNESFARAQYQSLSDADKLSKPSFEKMQGGVEISMGDSAVKNGKMVRKKIKYELTIIDKEPRNNFPFGSFILELGMLFVHFIKGSSISKSKLSDDYRSKLKPFDTLLEVNEELFTVAFQNNNTAFDSHSTFSSEMEAESFMKEKIRVNPDLKKQIHIIPQYELQEI